MKNKDTYFIVTFDDLQTLEDLQLLAQRVNITGINVIQDIPSAYKAAWSPIKTRNYLVEPVRDTLEQISGDLSITEKLKILTSLEKRDQVPANYIIPVIFFTPQRQEAQEIFTIAHLQNYLEQQKKLVEKLKLESKDELVEDKETAAVPILAVNSDDLVIYQRTLLSLNKANMTRNKYTCFCYLDNLSSDYWRQLFNVYQVQQQMTEIFFVVVLRSVISQANIEELAQKFYFTKQLNIFTYRSGLHKALQAKHAFEGQLFLLFNEQNELAIASQYIFETRNKVLRDLNEKKLRTLIPEVTFEKDCVIVRGQVIKFCQQLKPYDKQKRVVVAVFDQSEKDFQKTLHHYTVLTKKHRTCYFITIFKNEVEATSLKKKYEDCLQLNICIDQGQAVQFLNENDMQRTKVFNIFQDLQFDCSCNDLNKMQDLILDYSGTEWELGLPFKNKQLQFLNKSQLRAPGQPYVLSFFEYKDETTLLKMITEYYQKVQSAFSGIYFITCIQNITINSVQQLESFRNNIYYFQEMNLVEDQDNICDRVLSQPIYNPGSEFAEDEEYDQVKSACFIFNETNQMVEAHANALDCRVFCSNVYNFRGWPTSHQNGIIEIDELEHQMAFKGQKIRFLQKVNYYKPGQNILVTKVDHKAKDFEQFIAENTSIKKCPQIYQIIIAKDIKQFKDYEDIANKFKGLDINLIEDKIAMPAPRLEMKKEVDKKAADKKEELVVQEDGRCFQSSILFGSNLQSFKPIIELDDLDRQVQRLQKIEIQESDRELEDEIQCTDKLTGVLQDDLTFRGQKFKYINKATNFPTPPRDDYFIENLEKSHFVLAIFNSNAFSYEDQMFQFYKATQIISKLYGACLLKGVAQATDLELLKKKFHFASRLNLLNYKQGLLKKYYKLDGKFDQIFLVFNGSGALKFKCNFVCELEEYARSRQDLECFAFDQKKIVPDVDKNGQYLSLKGVNYKYMSQVTQHDQQQGLVLAVINSEEKRPGDDTKVKVTELLKSYKELIKKQNTTIFITLLTSSDATSIYPDLKDMNCVENYQGIAQKLLRGSEKCFYVFRNNVLDTVCPELKQMQEVVDKFIETRSEAIKDVVTSIKQTDIKNDDSAELGIDKKKVKKRVKVDGK
ncbi:Conserved_hypothetical protein [Hexamita inflata]|uniref:Uncharacterized protein n=1 Tax=Hexamita inflata TaxID=28002 RepID=A0AA86REV9_9EUKA|nr:Conserved hypothetical protein [Hexamita inflata]CAI9919960.1 Conserved hypothetical protein [Hexamita inflata]CAI9971973.1 Conserved hypothetical protein [Hexamita inflata]